LLAYLLYIIIDKKRTQLDTGLHRVTQVCG
jgi:hypothetical protein